MEDFIIFSNTCGGRTMVRKSTIVSIFEDNEDATLGNVTVSTSDGDEFVTNDSFDSIISKLTK
jgi:hypothetical protein